MPPVGSGAPTVMRFLTREYTWGPGDGPAGVDELLAMFEGGPPGATASEALAIQSKPYFVLQDAGGDVIALCDQPTTITSASGLAAPTGPARIVAQFTYDAYGSILTAEGYESFGIPHPAIHCGHKGLFLDRLDGGIVATGGSSGSAGAPSLPRLERHAQVARSRLTWSSTKS